MFWGLHLSGEEEEAEQRQSPPDDWSKMDKDEVG